MRRCLAAGLSVALLATACTRAANDEAVPTSSPPASSAPTTALPDQSHVTTTTGTAPDPHPTTTEPAPLPVAHQDREALLQSWAEDRAEAVERILAGADAPELDLEDCGPEWSNTGPETGPIRLVWWHSYHHSPGPESVEAYLAWLGDEATAGGRPIEIAWGGNEAWDPWDTLTEEQAAQHVAANRQMVGELADLGIAVLNFREFTNNRSFPFLFDDACLPLLGVGSTFPREPASHPWVAPSIERGPAAEGAAWARHHARAEPGTSATILAMDNGYGHRFVDGFESASGPLGVDSVVHLHDPAAPDLSELAASIASQGPSTVYLATAGNGCRSATLGLRAAGFDGPIVLPASGALFRCTSMPSMDTGLPGVVGLHTLAGDWTSLEGPFPDSEFSQAALALTPADQLPWSRIDTDWFMAWYAVEVLKIAAELPGGLTRSNIVRAMWNFDSEFPHAAGRLTVQWPDDVELVENFAHLVWDPDQARWLLPDAQADSRPTRELDREALLNRWADERATTVAHIRRNDWGVREGRLVGPDGLQVDLRECETQWTPPQQGEPIELGLFDWDQHWAADGGFREFFDWMGDAARVADRHVVLTSLSQAVGREDVVGTEEGYRRIDEDLLRYAGDHHAAVVRMTTVGLDLTRHRSDLLDGLCLPVIGGHSAFAGDELTTPWFAPATDLSPSVDAELSLKTEALRSLGHDDVLAVLASDMDFGHRIVDSLRGGLDGSGVTVQVVFHHPAAPDLTADVEELLRRDPAAIVIASAGNACVVASAAIGAADGDLPVVASSACGGTEWEPEGRSIQQLVATYGADDHHVDDTPHALVPGADEEGWIQAWHALQVLQVAAELRGGLTRANILLAAWTHRATHPFLEGEVDPAADRRAALTSARVHEWNPAARTWLPTIEVVSIRSN